MKLLQICTIFDQKIDDWLKSFDHQVPRNFDFDCNFSKKLKTWLANWGNTLWSAHWRAFENFICQSTAVIFTTRSGFLIRCPNDNSMSARRLVRLNLFIANVKIDSSLSHIVPESKHLLREQFDIYVKIIFKWKRFWSIFVLLNWNCPPFVIEVLNFRLYRWHGKP